MGEINVINPFQSSEPHFPIIGVISAYKSCTWDVQLYGRGYFELVIPATQENLDLIKPNRMLVRECDIHTSPSTFYNNAMIIRKIDLSYNADEGYMLTVSGKLIKDLLSQRIIWHQYNANTNIWAVVYDLLCANVVDPWGWATDMITYYGTIIANLTEELQALNDAKDQAYDDWQDAISEYGADSPEAAQAKAVYDHAVEAVEDKQAEIDEQTVYLNRWIRRQSMMVGRDLPYFSSLIPVIPEYTPPTYTAQLHGENLGEWLENVCYELQIGWDVVLYPNQIIFTFIVGDDKTSTVIFSPEFDNLKTSSYITDYETYKNGGQVGGEGEGEDQESVKIAIDTPDSPSRSPINQYLFETYIDGSGVSSNGQIITQHQYRMLLIGMGETEIMKYPVTKSFDGEIETEGVFKINVDYRLGDKVTVTNEQGMTSPTRLIEVVYIHDSNGTQTQAYFEKMEA